MHGQSTTAAPDVRSTTAASPTATCERHARSSTPRPHRPAREGEPSSPTLRWHHCLAVPSSTPRRRDPECPSGLARAHSTAIAGCGADAGSTSPRRPRVLLPPPSALGMPSASGTSSSSGTPSALRASSSSTGTSSSSSTVEPRSKVAPRPASSRRPGGPRRHHRRAPVHVLPVGRPTVSCRVVASSACRVGSPLARREPSRRQPRGVRRSSTPPADRRHPARPGGEAATRVRRRGPRLYAAARHLTTRTRFGVVSSPVPARLDGAAASGSADNLPCSMSSARNVSSLDGACARRGCGDRRIGTSPDDRFPGSSDPTVDPGPGRPTAAALRAATGSGITARAKRPGPVPRPAAVSPRTRPPSSDPAADPMDDPVADSVSRRASVGRAGRRGCVGRVSVTGAESAARRNRRR